MTDTKKYSIKDLPQVSAYDNMSIDELQEQYKIIVGILNQQRGVNVFDKAYKLMAKIFNNPKYERKIRKLPEVIEVPEEMIKQTRGLLSCLNASARLKDSLSKK